MDTLYTRTHTHSSSGVFLTPNEFKLLYQCAVLSFYCPSLLSGLFITATWGMKRLDADGPRGASSIVCASQLSRGLSRWELRAESSDATPPPDTHTHAHACTHTYTHIPCGGWCLCPHKTVSHRPKWWSSRLVKLKVEKAPDLTANVSMNTSRGCFQLSLITVQINAPHENELRSNY